jgi:hypothetical protein
MTQRMGKGTIFLSYLVLLYSRYVESDVFYDVLNKVDLCEAFCEKTYPGITNANVSSNVPLFCKSHVFGSVLTRPLFGSRRQPCSWRCDSGIVKGFVHFTGLELCVLQSHKTILALWVTATCNSSRSFMTNEQRHVYLQGKLADAHFQLVFKSRTGKSKRGGWFYFFLLQLNSR